jgi:DTW domain-containing protein YfiP
MQRRLTMPSRSRKSDHCDDCRLFRPLCVCEIVAKTRLELAGLRTQVVTLMHVRELTLPTNTARLATAAIPGAELRLRGSRDERMATEGLVTSDRQSAVLFPTSDALELNADSVARLTREGAVPLRLIVLDGSWRQARKAIGRIPEIEGLPRVKLPPGPLSRYRLRKEPTEASVCTFEAIARALGVIEGAVHGPRVQAALEELFELRIERTLWSRGVVPTAECRFPIPQKAFDAFAAAGARGQANPQRLRANGG